MRIMPASQVVQELEAVGIPADDISIIASNADNWYSGRGTLASSATHDRDRDGVEVADLDWVHGCTKGGLSSGEGLLIGLKVPRRVRASAQPSAESRVCWQVSG
jgi:hypothetical protein